MAEIVIDTTAQDIIDDVVETIENATVAGDPVFTVVTLVESVEWFDRFDDALMVGRSACGIVASRPQRRDGTDNGMEEMFLLTLQAVVKHKANVPLTGEVSADVSALNDKIDVIRKALLIDPTRGGKCCNVMWGSQLVEGTSVDGDPKPLKGKPNSTIISAVIPILCAWVVNES